MEGTKQQFTEWYIIVNPAAANGRVGKKWPKIKEQLFQNIGVMEWAATQRAGQATGLAKAAIEKGYTKLIAVGGDGTNNEVINGIMSQKMVPSANITYALLPVGTGNDWIKTHQIPKRLEGWIKMLQHGQTIVQDIGKVHYTKEGQQQERYFANVAGLAYDAYLVKNIEQKKSKIAGAIVYIFFLLVYLLKYRLTKARVTFDQEVVENYFYTINAGICRYSGGGMQIVPHANPSDGYLALTLAGKVSKLKILLNTFRLYNGTIDQLKEIDSYQVKNIKVEAMQGQTCWVEVDGEFLGEAPVSISIVEKALRVVVRGEA